MAPHTTLHGVTPFYTQFPLQNMDSQTDVGNCTPSDEDMTDHPVISSGNFGPDRRDYTSYEAFPEYAYSAALSHSTYSTNDSLNSNPTTVGAEDCIDSSRFFQGSGRRVFDEPELLLDSYFPDRSRPYPIFPDSGFPDLASDIIYESNWANGTMDEYTEQYQDKRNPTTRPITSKSQSQHGKPPTICPKPGCGTRLSKRGDLARHIAAKHNDNKKRYMCGTCDDNKRRKEGYTREEKWKDHNKKEHDVHKRVSTIWKCPLCKGPDNLEDLCFGSEPLLKHHMSEAHRDEILGSSPSSMKRGHDSTATHNTKRARFDVLTDEPVEIVVSNVEVSDFLALSKDKELRNDIEEFLRPRTIGGHDGPAISFNAPRRSVRLQGPQKLISKLKGLLDIFLGQRRSPQAAILCPTSFSVLCRGFKSLTGPTTQLQHGPKTFPMRYKEDADLLQVWHEQIIPALPALLSKTLGNGFSAGLVRKGRSATSGAAVVQIQSHNVPSQTVQDIIRKQILGLSNQDLHFQFLGGRLTTLAGESDDIHEVDEHTEQEYHEPEEAEPESYPFYKRYWPTPGSGASIGLLCTKQIAATICCYVNVDGKLYVLTVKHFVTKSYEHPLRGVTDMKTVVSPALADVDDMKSSFKQRISDFELELDEAVKEHLGDQYSEFVSIRDIASTSDRAQDILETQAYVQRDYSLLMSENLSLKLGSLEHQSTSPSKSDTPVSPLSGQAKYKPHLDWALCSVLPERTGSNRHRYQYDVEEDTIDFYSGETDTYGAGDQFVETCTIEPNTKVHYVGQATGRQHGEINAARMIISHAGVISEEWAMVKSAKSQADSTIHKGDSGAAIIRDSDNKLAGLLWASTKDGQLVFSPINAVFDDIRQNLDASCVSLPPLDPSTQSMALNTPTEVELICRDKSVESPKPHRKYRTTDMPTPRPKRSHIRPISVRLASGTHTQDKSIETLKIYRKLHPIDNPNPKPRASVVASGDLVPGPQFYMDKALGSVKRSATDSMLQIDWSQNMFLPHNDNKENDNKENRYSFNFILHGWNHKKMGKRASTFPKSGRHLISLNSAVIPQSVSVIS